MAADAANIFEVRTGLLVEVPDAAEAGRPS
jgi:hypothetical protein